MHSAVPAGILGQYPGIEFREGLRIDSQAAGEHGIGHFRRALRGHIVKDPRAALKIVNDVLKEMNVKPIEMVYFRAARKHLRGNYHRSVIQIFGYPRLATLLHEAAHHATYNRHGFVQKHGYLFKKTFVELFTEFGKLSGFPMQFRAQECLYEEIKEVQEFRSGAEVISRSGRRFRIIGKRRTRYLLKCMKTGEEYTANPASLTLVKPETTENVTKTNRQIAAAVKEASPESKRGPVVEKGLKFQVGDRVFFGRQKDFWTVTGYTAEGRVTVIAEGPDRRDPTRWPAGRSEAFAERSLKKM